MAPPYSPPIGFARASSGSCSCSSPSRVAWSEWGKSGLLRAAAMFIVSSGPGVLQLNRDTGGEARLCSKRCFCCLLHSAVLCWGVRLHTFWLQQGKTPLACGRWCHRQQRTPPSSAPCLASRQAGGRRRHTVRAAFGGACRRIPTPALHVLGRLEGGTAVASELPAPLLYEACIAGV